VACGCWEKKKSPPVVLFTAHKERHFPCSISQIKRRLKQVGPWFESPLQGRKGKKKKKVDQAPRRGSHTGRRERREEEKKEKIARYFRSGDRGKKKGSPLFLFVG